MKYKGFLSPYVQQKPQQRESSNNSQNSGENNQQLTQLIKDLMALKKNMGDFVDQKIQEHSGVVDQVLQSHQGLSSKIDQAISQIDTHRQLQRGDKGDMPKAGVDYRIPKDGRSPDPEEIVPLVLAKIPKPKNGRTPVKGVDYRDGAPGKNATPQDVVEIIKTTKALRAEHIDGLDKSTEIMIDTYNMKKGIKPYIHGGGDTVTAGSNVTITTNSQGQKVISSTAGGTGTVTSVGVTGANGIGVAGSPITNAGSIALSLGAITPTSVNGVVVSGSSIPTLSVTGTTTISGSSSGTNTGDQAIFQNIAVAGQSTIIADSTIDTLTLVAGSNITITTDAFTDTITIAAATPVATGILIESITGTIDGSNRVFTVGHTPVWVTLAGQTLINGDGFVLSGSTITFDSAPQIGQTIHNFYNGFIPTPSGGGNFLGLLTPINQ